MLTWFKSGRCPRTAPPFTLRSCTAQEKLQSHLRFQSRTADTSRMGKGGSVWWGGHWHSENQQRGSPVRSLDQSTVISILISIPLLSSLSLSTKKRPRKAYLYQDNSLNSNVDLPKSNNAVKTDIWLCFEKDGLLWGAEAWSFTAKGYRQGHPWVLREDASKSMRQCCVLLPLNRVKKCTCKGLPKRGRNWLLSMAGYVCIKQWRRSVKSHGCCEPIFN